MEFLTVLVRCWFRGDVTQPLLQSLGRCLHCPSRARAWRKPSTLFSRQFVAGFGGKVAFKKIGHLDLAFQGSNRIMLYHSYWNTQYQCWSMPRFVFNFLRSPTWHYHRWILWTTRHIDRDLFCASILVNIQTWNLPKVYTSFPSNSRKDRAFGT